MHSVIQNGNTKHNIPKKSRVYRRRENNDDYNEIDANILILIIRIIIRMLLQLIIIIMIIITYNDNNQY